MFLLLPIGHNRQLSRLPYFALGVMGLCLLVQLWSSMAWWYRIQGHTVLAPIDLAGYVPITGLHPNLLLNTFVHGGWFHLAGNMLFLYVTALNLEDRWGWQVFAPFYLVAGVIASMAYGAVHPTSTIALVGASGAVAAAMGAFLVCFFNAQIKMWYVVWALVFVRSGTFFTRAYVILPIWFVAEVVFASSEGNSLVAHSAHVAGFAFGAAFAGVMRGMGWDQRIVADHEREHELWSEDPDYLRALEHIGRGDPTAARPLLEALLRRTPHLEARVELARLAAHQNDATAAALHGSAAIDALFVSDLQRTADVFAELVGSLPELALSDTALAHAAQAAFAERDVPRTFDATRRLLCEHPTSAEVPRAMLAAAELQGLHGRADLERETLENLVEVFPTTPLADEARHRLTRMPPSRRAVAGT